MALKCLECSDKLIFTGGVHIGKIDLELHSCYRCNQLYSYNAIKGKLKEYPETKTTIKKGFK